VTRISEWSWRGRLRRLALAGTLGAVAAVLPSAVAAVLPSAVAAGLQAPPARTYYIAVGASESLGVQPTASTRHSAPTDDGYANALVDIERVRWPGLRLVHFGCPGITAQAALLGNGSCRFAAGSEIQAATDFLRRHPGKTVLATVDFGFNDVWPCLAGHSVDPACVTAAFGAISKVLPITLHDLRAAGGPAMKVVGLLHNDPCLASYLRGTAGQAFSAAALKVFDRFNTLLASIYTRAGVSAANVPAAFSVGAPSTVALGAHGIVPLDVAKVCNLTWMCRERNLHPNAAGYQVIAEAIAAALPRPSEGRRRSNKSSNDSKSSVLPSLRQRARPRTTSPEAPRTRPGAERRPVVR